MMIQRFLSEGPSWREYPARSRATLRGIFVAWILLGSFGCTLFRIGPIEPSSSYPTAGQAVPARGSLPGLWISTNTYLDLHLGDAQAPSRYVHSGYTIYDERGAGIMHIPNHFGTEDVEPTSVDLEPGRYLIRLDEPHGRSPIFWVTVQPGMLTKVNADDLPGSP